MPITVNGNTDAATRLRIAMQDIQRWRSELPQRPVDDASSRQAAEQLLDRLLIPAAANNAYMREENALNLPQLTFQLHAHAGQSTEGIMRGLLEPGGIAPVAVLSEPPADAPRSSISGILRPPRTISPEGIPTPGTPDSAGLWVAGAVAQPAQAMLDRANIIAAIGSNPLFGGIASGPEYEEPRQRVLYNTLTAPGNQPYSQLIRSVQQLGSRLNVRDAEGPPLTAEQQAEVLDMHAWCGVCHSIGNRYASALVSDRSAVAREEAIRRVRDTLFVQTSNGYELRSLREDSVEQRSMLFMSTHELYYGVPRETSSLRIPAVEAAVADISPAELLTPLATPPRNPSGRDAEIRMKA